MNQLLSNVRVIDLTRMLSGPFGSAMLGDAGAEIIKIEPPGGDEMRTMGPHFQAGLSAYFASINRNKKSVVIDLKSDDGRAILYDLVKSADVVLDNFRPGVLRRLKLDYETLKTHNPRIVHCSISSFGQTGPYRELPAFDLILQAMSGAMSVTGEPFRTPVRLGLPMGDLAGGMYAAFAIAAALFRRERAGEGAKIDLGLMDCLASLNTYMAQYYFTGGEVPGPQGSGHRFVVPYQVFKTKDIYLVVAIFVEKFWTAFCNVLEVPDLIADPRFADAAARSKNREVLIPMLEAKFVERPGDEWIQALWAARVPAGPIHTLDRLASDPQFRARNMVVQIEHPTTGPMTTLGTPVKVEGTSDANFAPPPTLGEHTAEVLRDLLGYDAQRIQRLTQAGAIH